MAIESYSPKESNHGSKHAQVLAKAKKKKAPYGSARAFSSFNSLLFLLAPSVLILACGVGYEFYRRRPFDVLSFLAKDQFDWDKSTTTIPISGVSVVLKKVLARNYAPLEHLYDDTIRVQTVRDILNAERLAALKAVCRTGGKRKCVFDRIEREFGTNALHIAAMNGDDELLKYLREMRVPDVFDFAGRKASNLTYANFISNSKKWAKLDDCDLPSVVYDGSEEAKKEVRRLVNEGEPILIRGAMNAIAPELVSKFSVQRLLDDHGDVKVTVGSVPYAAYFNLTTTRMTLSEFTESTTKGDGARRYIFAKDAGVCRDGYNALHKLITDAFPMDSLIVSPEKSGGVAETHFFLGNKRSGAPFHLHADAVNVAVSGRKQWYIYTPKLSLYSRTPISQWVDTALSALDEKDRPLQCTQYPGDVVYVPLDWGHAVENLSDETFGFALELLNRRDTLMEISQ